MAVINRVPQGFLGVLDAKTQGQSPADVSPVLSAGIDLTQFYLGDRPLNTAVATTAGVNANGVVAGSAITVPDGELWFVYAAQTQAISTAGTAGHSFSWRLTTLDNNFLHGRQFNSGLAIATGITAIAQDWFETGLHVPAGCVFAPYVAFIGGGNVFTVTMAVLYRSVQV